MQTGPTLRVLIVDDTRLLRELLAFTVENDDRFSVAGCAADGAQAIRLVEQDQTDAIILDLQMPQMDGLTALPRLRQLCPDAFIAAHSFDGEALERAVGLGADLSVAKGSGLDELLDAIVVGRKRVVGSTRARRTALPEQEIPDPMAAK
jgi:DNA-binding NarL/FixJ family response regulator